MSVFFSVSFSLTRNINFFEKIPFNPSFLTASGRCPLLARAFQPFYSVSSVCWVFAGVHLSPNRMNLTQNIIRKGWWVDPKWEWKNFQNDPKMIEKNVQKWPKYTSRTRNSLHENLFTLQIWLNSKITCLIRATCILEYSLSRKAVSWSRQARPKNAFPCMRMEGGVGVSDPKIMRMHSHHWNE